MIVTVVVGVLVGVLIVGISDGVGDTPASGSGVCDPGLAGPQNDSSVLKASGYTASPQSSSRMISRMIALSSGSNCKRGHEP